MAKFYGIDLSLKLTNYPALRTSMKTKLGVTDAQINEANDEQLITYLNQIKS